MLLKHLENGVEVFLHQDTFTDSVCVQCWVGVGSMMEAEHEGGMSHYIEHMLFKGTDKIGPGEFAGQIEAYGGSVNAYTTFDRTVFYFNIASQYADKGIELLADCIFNSKFDPIEFDREKEVILEEIKRGMDDPGSRLGKELFKNCYQNSTAGLPIIGTSELVSGYKREDVLDYYRKWYVPHNMRIVAVGNFAPATIYEDIKKFFGLHASKKPPKVHLDRGDFPKGQTYSILRGDYQQPRIQIAFPAPELVHSDTALLDLACYALGSGDTSRLAKTLRDKEKLVAAASAGVYSPMFGGIALASAYPTEETYLECIKSLVREVFLIRDKNPPTEVEVERARVNIKSETYYQEESLEGFARSIGQGLMTPLKEFYEAAYMKIIDEATPVQVQQALERWVSFDNMVVVGMVPETSKITKEDVKKAVSEGFEAAKAAKAQTTKLQGAKSTKKSERVAERRTLDCGVELIYRQHDESKLFNLVAATEGGSRAESDENKGIFNAISGLLCDETLDKDYDTFTHYVEDRGASLGGFTGKDSIGMSLICLQEDWKDFVALFSESLLKPKFSPQQWETSKRQILQSLHSQDDSPSSICVRKFQELVFGEHPYRYNSYGSKETVETFDEKKLLAYFNEFRDKGNWIITGVGATEFEVVYNELNKVFAGWKVDNKPRDFGLNQAAEALPQKVFETVKKDREQAHLLYGFKGISWRDKDRAALDVLSSILGGQGGRLFIKLRDQQSLAYSVSPIANYGADPWAIGAYIACSPDKTDQALTGLEKEMLDFCTNAPSKAEVESAINYIIGNHELGLQTGKSQASTMALMHLYGNGFDDFKTYTDRVAKVTPVDVQRVAKRLFVPENSVTVVVSP